MKKIIHLIILFSFLVSCSREIEINKMPVDYTSYDSFQTAGLLQWQKSEAFVIKNPPKDPRDILRVVDSFNRETLILPDTNINYDYRRIFYKETRFTPRTYKEFVLDYGDDVIGDHIDDHLVSVNFYVWQKIKCVRVGYIFYNYPDSFYHSVHLYFNSRDSIPIP